MKNKEKTNLSTAIYVRVSTEEQAQEGFSIRGQTEKLKAYAMLKEWDIYNIYGDEGISGKSIVERPGINRLIEDIKEGHVNNVLVFKVDRLTRSTKNLIELVELFEEHDCIFNSLTESIDTDTPSGRMFLKIIGIFAEFERENLASRLKLGFERKAKEGYSLASARISLGYNKKKGQKVQEVQLEESRIVKEIFSMFVEDNFSMTKIAIILNERKAKTKYNAIYWTAKTIQRILSNPTYIGKVRYAMNDRSRYFESEGHHEKILDDEIFYLAQQKMKRTKKSSRKKYPKEDNYFCGILFCDLCGGKFTTQHGAKGKNVSYKCSNRIHYAEPPCECPNIIHHKVEKVFTEYIEKINDFVSIDNIDIESTQDTSKHRDELEYIATCEKKLRSLQNGKKRVMEQYVNEEITFEEYREMLTISNEKGAVLENEIQKLTLEISTDEENRISHDDVILSLKENWEYLSNKEKMIFLQRFIEKIVVKVEKVNARVSMATIKHIEFCH